jgi:hypothetical protein
MCSKTPENSSDATRLMTKQKYWVQSSAAKHVVMMNGQLDESATSEQQKHPNAMVAHLAACGLQDAIVPSFPAFESNKQAFLKHASMKTYS